ncbi:hypothetical protein QN386_21830 [Pseudomonas sp. CCI3.2]|uniref:hypothetical protein n=1 Tax=unclassified Pseudomonas TaxID=196821 RepID=UPI002AC97FEF|nr:MULTISPECIES: hypothetical protein [unclassified Pseudomonas]MEB0080099.1 hypothetical protein [Pseudomonas sp. MH10out]MEB0094031.1 hypothetical protein [Pseudomonas sp. CCI4.2]MEB0103947.1 hypothetical protein [Pseudomonas sp. CCI3.2]MEB0133191.1 hypothetical protein [Pseudomonas sp. CCI2.4]MEB0160317.1 hypothetical protein [Pseudomonas sp. AH2 (2023)]
MNTVAGIIQALRANGGAVLRLSIVFTLFISRFAIAGNTPMVSNLIVDYPNVRILSCDIITCEPLKLSNVFLDEWNDSSLSLVDINLDGHLDIILTRTGDVNLCSVAYSVDRHARTLSAINIDSLCNYRLEHEYLISTYRTGAKWFEDIYRIKDGVFHIYIRDECLDCDYINRTLYTAKGKQEMLVTSDDNFQERLLKKAKVLSERASLYSSPSSKHRTKAYLIIGDEIFLSGYFSEKAESWFYVRYENINGRSISRWIKESDLEIIN